MTRSDPPPSPHAPALIALVATGLGFTSPACSSTYAHGDPGATLTATVVRIVDGDTLDVVDDRRGKLRIRVLGINTPEVHDPNGHGVGCWGPQASDFARATLTGQRVTIVADPTQDDHDRYGRTLAYVEKPGNWDYSIEAARAGAARSYVYEHHPAIRAPQIAAAEEDAQRAGRGLWGPPCHGHTESTPPK